MSAPTTDQEGIARVVRALVADGWTPYGCDGGDGLEPLKGGSMEAEAAVMDYDDAFLFVRKGVDGGWVRFVMGNEPEEVAADWTVNLTAVETETREWWGE